MVKLVRTTSAVVVFNASMNGLRFWVSIMSSESITFMYAPVMMRMAALITEPWPAFGLSITVAFGCLFAYARAIDDVLSVEPSFIIRISTSFDVSSVVIESRHAVRVFSALYAGMMIDSAGMGFCLYPGGYFLLHFEYGAAGDV